MSDYHIPVMLKESVDGLVLKNDGVYIDVTFGAGGHTNEILSRLSSEGKVFAFDQDREAQENVVKDDRLTFTLSNFRHIEKFMRVYGHLQVDGILADLGVSSHQFDADYRGFSYRFDGELDMRMNLSSEFKAKDVLNEYRKENLWKIFGEYGEVRNAKTLADRIVKRRVEKKFGQIADFLEFLDSVKIGERMKYLSQVFQALRIEVNEEYEVLNELMESCLRLLKPGGRLSVMSYHSGEDRIVKRFMKTGNVKGEMVKDDYGKIDRPFKLINKRVIEASSEEKKLNPRSRSAKLRVAEKV